MVNVRKFIIILFVLFITTACNNDDSSSKEDKLELFILRRVEDAEDLVIDETPIFTDKDILSYEWDTHTIIFNEKFLASHETNETEDDIIMGGSKILRIYYPDQFALLLNGEELYRGYIQPQVNISFLPMGPMISNYDDGIIIKCYDEKLDTRDNDKLKAFLKDNDLLR